MSSIGTDGRSLKSTRGGVSARCRLPWFSLLDMLQRERCERYESKKRSDKNCKVFRFYMYIVSGFILSHHASAQKQCNNMKCVLIIDRCDSTSEKLSVSVFNVNKLDLRLCKCTKATL